MTKRQTILDDFKEFMDHLDLDIPSYEPIKWDKTKYTPIVLPKGVTKEEVMAVILEAITGRWDIKDLERDDDTLTKFFIEVRKSPSINLHINE